MLSARVLQFFVKSMLVATATTVLTSCDSAPKQTQQEAQRITTPSPPAKPLHIGEIEGVVFAKPTKNGIRLQNDQMLQAGPTEDIVFMATWCPHSLALKRALNDPSVRPYLSGRTISFIFMNEWPTVKSELKDLVAAGKLPANELDSKLSMLKQRSGSKYLFDPQFLHDLPGNTYISDRPPSEVTSFPTVMTASGFGDRLSWFANTLGMNRSLAAAVLLKYEDSEDSGE